jgi:phage terminase large subunit GpA-like protein
MNLTSMLNRSVAECLTPPPKMTVSEWADAERVLSPESSAEPGRWRTNRAPYLRGIMDAFTDPLIEGIVWKSSAQVGKTETLNNCIAYAIATDPAPVLLLQPTLELAEAWSKDRLAPMLRDTPALRGLVKDSRSRDANNTLLHKVFPGGHITMAGANSPASLASRPIRYLFCDEVDRYPASAGPEGDPVSLANKRTTTFWNRKRVYTSTPTIEGASRIDMAFQNSDQRFYFVPCPSCDQMQRLVWANVKWEKDKPETAKYECEYCNFAIDNRQKTSMLARGEWRATAEFRGVAGFHLSEIYSPWVAWSRMAEHFLESKKHPETLKTWINTSLGETWSEAGETVDDGTLFGRREHYSHEELPQGVCLLTAGIDVQDKRLEVEVVGWGRGEESWGVMSHVIPHGPENPEAWKMLDEFLSQTFEHPTGVTLRIVAACVDSGFATQHVYRYVKPRQARRVYATKGVPGAGKPGVGRPTTANRAKVNLLPLGVDSLKEVLYSRLRQDEPGPGYCHFPMAYEREWFEQLTAEKIVTKFRFGHPYRIWEKVRARNEALDCRVLAYAALLTLAANTGKMLDKIAHDNARAATEIAATKTVVDQAQPEATNGDTVEPPKTTPKKRLRVNRPFVGGWKLR